MEKIVGNYENKQFSYDLWMCGFWFQCFVDRDEKIKKDVTSCWKPGNMEKTPSIPSWKKL
jgi:hypothetical protein